MAKIVGLDVGDARVGVAVADASVRIATPHKTFRRADGEAEVQILKILRENNVELLVVGIPLDEHGGRTTQCDKVESFCRRLTRRHSLTVVFVDEHLSTVEAEHQLISAGSKRRHSRQKGVLDAAAASIILQSFLDSENK